MQTGWKMVIDSQGTLEKAADYYHDQHFDLDNVIFDEEKREFSIEYWRVIFEEAEQTKDYILCQVIVAPIIRTKLIFRHVYDMKIWEKEPDDQMTYIKYNSAKSEIQFECAKSTKILLKVKKLDGILKDVGERVSDQYKYKTLLYWIEISRPVHVSRDCHKSVTKALFILQLQDYLRSVNPQCRYHLIMTIGSDCLCRGVSTTKKYMP